MCMLSLLLLGALAFFIVNKKRGPFGRPGLGNPLRGEGKQAPEDLLAERFAEGDITDEEYWQRLSVLQESKGGSR